MAKQLAPPVDVKKVFHTYAEESDVLTAEKLKQFLNDFQGEKNVSLEDAQKVLDQELAKEGPHLLSKAKNGLTLDSFFHYLLDPIANSALNDKPYQDMTLPASHYFVYTGHNSYLTGNQLSSACSEAPIIDALKRGVRVIELDLWPNKKGDNINVLHGGTMTSPVKFEKCMNAIRDYAFVASPYPVVITFEDHLTPDLQAMAAKITTRVLGKLLKIPDDTEKFTEFPSPDAMKGRILISTKPPKEYLKGQKPKQGGMNLEKVAERVRPIEKVVGKMRLGKKEGKSSTDAGVQKEEFDWGDEIPDFDASSSRAKLDPSEVPVETDVNPNCDGDSDDNKDESGDIDNVVHPEYRKIIFIRAEKPKGKSLKDSLLVNEFVRRVSLSEPQLEKVAKKYPEALIKFTERNLLRIYPYGLRFNSSNYNPLIAWAHGAQMVAFNMQGYGRPLWLVHGFFRANGACGYVLKPKFLFPSTNGIVFDPRKEVQPRFTLKVKVIMGLGWLEKFGKHYFDTFSPPDFYTRVGIAGVTADTVMKRTEAIEDEWLPQWEVEFEFPLTVPELALLRVEVHEYDMTDKDDFGGQTCIPVLEIKRGFRSIPLFDKQGRELEGVRLLFHFEFISHAT